MVQLKGKTVKNAALCAGSKSMEAVSKYTVAPEMDSLAMRALSGFGGTGLGHYWHRKSGKIGSEPTITFKLAVSLDEVFVKISGEMHHLWLTVDHEGESLEPYVTKRRDLREP